MAHDGLNLSSGAKAPTPAEHPGAASHLRSPSHRRADPATWPTRFRRRDLEGGWTGISDSRGSELVRANPASSRRDSRGCVGPVIARESPVLPPTGHTVDACFPADCRSLRSGRSRHSPPGCGAFPADLVPTRHRPAVSLCLYRLPQRTRCQGRLQPDHLSDGIGQGRQRVPNRPRPTRCQPASRSARRRLDATQGQVPTSHPRPDRPGATLDSTGSCLATTTGAESLRRDDRPLGRTRLVVTAADPPPRPSHHHGPVPQLQPRRPVRAGKTGPAPPGLQSAGRSARLPAAAPLRSNWQHSWPTGPRTPRDDWWTDCSPRLTTANVGAATGWT